MESITLYFRQGPSDKVYQASIRSHNDGYMVHFAYGRRGSTLSAGTKTESPVHYTKAKWIYDTLWCKLLKGSNSSTLRILAKFWAHADRCIYWR